MSRSRHNFLRLGSRDSALRRLGVDRRLQLLNTAFKQGVPVPPGILLLHEGWERLQQDGIVTVNGDDVHVSSAETLLETFALARLRQAVTVRTPAAADAVTIAPGDPDRLIEALVAAWRSAESTPTARRDLLVMEAVPARHSGQAVTGRSGSADTITTDGGPTVTLPPLRRFRQPDRDQPPHVQRVQRLLQGVRRALSLENDSRWAVTWADDGQRCWLLRLTPTDAA